MFTNIQKAALLLLATLAAPAQVRDPLPVPDIPGYRTLKCDFHIHTVFSDGSVWPSIRVEEAWREGLDAIAITDHADYTPHKADVKPDLSRASAVARDAAAQSGIIVIPGFEISGERSLHFNSLFVEDASGMGELSVKEALTRARAQKAFIFWNHPGWKETPQWFPLVKELHDAKLLDGMEIVNGLNFYPEAYPWIEEKTLTPVANTDVHALTALQYPNRTRPITLVFAKTADAEGIREALFARRTAAWMGGKVWGQEAHLKALWDGGIELKTPELRVKRGGRTALQIYNRSAIPFQVRVADHPAWFRPGLREIAAEKISPAFVTIPKDAPLGAAKVELKLAVTNLYIGPGKELMVTLPVTVTVE